MIINKKKIIKKGSEADVQRAVVRFLSIYHKDVLYCATNGGVKLSYMQAARMKMTGYVAGVPDLLIFEPRGEYHGLMIELKRDEKSKPSTTQLAWQEKLTARKYRSVVCHSIVDAINEIESYLKL